MLEPKNINIETNFITGKYTNSSDLNDVKYTEVNLDKFIKCHKFKIKEKYNKVCRHCRWGIESYINNNEKEYICGKQINCYEPKN